MIETGPGGKRTIHYGTDEKPVKIEEEISGKKYTTEIKYDEATGKQKSAITIDENKKFVSSEEYYENGSVKSRTVAAEENDKPIRKTEDYDEKGRTTRKVLTDENSKPISETQYKYNNDINRPVSEKVTTFNDDGTLANTLTRDFRAFDLITGKPSVIVETNSDGTQRIIQQNYDPITGKPTNQVITDKVKLNSEGKPIVCDENGEHVAELADGKYIYTDETTGAKYEYDPNTQKIKQIGTDTENPVLKMYKEAIDEKIADGQLNVQNAEAVREMLLSCDSPLDALDKLTQMDNPQKFLDDAAKLYSENPKEIQKLILSCDNPLEAIKSFSNNILKNDAKKLAINTLIELQNKGIDINDFLSGKPITYIKNVNDTVTFGYKKGQIEISYNGEKISSIYYHVGDNECPKVFFDENGNIDKIEYYNKQNAKFRNEAYKYKGDGGYIKTTTYTNKPNIEVVEDFENAKIIRQQG